jgi:hemerythrin-like domain-containing protein
VGGRFDRGRGRQQKDPIERLDRSHRRLEEQLDRFGPIVDAVKRGEAEGWSELDDIIRYLNEATLRHESDEEESVFPHLQAHPALRPLLERLSVDHASQRNLIETVNEIVSGLDRKRPNPASLARLARKFRTLAASYRDHIKREDRELMPAIQRYLSEADRAAIGAEMLARREK